MLVLSHDPHIGDFPENVQSVGLKRLLAESDVLSIHVPLNDTTIDLLDSNAINCMKPGAYLINTARGRIINEIALLDALQSGHLGGAALDVLSNETGLEGEWLLNNPLYEYASKHDNLILTPHIGGAIVEAMAETEMFMARKLQFYLQSIS